MSSIFLSSVRAASAESLVKIDNPAVETQQVVGVKATSRTNNWHAREGMKIRRNWGVDVIGVHPISTGFMLSFKYRVVDAEKAALLNDKRSKAYIIDQATGNVLGVPIMEKLGELRQKSPPELNRTYFIMFGNPGKLVKSGSVVSVVIGEFRIENLVVD